MTPDNKKPIKYFYTDPLASAWMSKHFGMCYHNPTELSKHWIGEKADYKYFLYYLSVWENYPERVEEPYKFYIHPDSLRLLELQDGDLVLANEMSGIWGKCIFDHDIEFEKNNLPLKVVPWKIIQRNGFAFMWPEVEA